MASTEKIAVVLFNLGGPSDSAAIRPFLFNFFMDRNIIQLPQPFRFLLALWISWSRGNGAAKEAYGQLGGASPILENTKKQAGALERALQEKSPGARVFVSMRYWHPMSTQTAKDVAAFGPDRVVLLPLYPQFSTTTSFSSFQDWHRAAAKAGITAPATAVCCYPTNPAFVEISAALVRRALEAAPQRVRVLFSAHGLPKRVIEQGDPYQWQTEATAQEIAGKLGLNATDWQVCYQSKVGRLPWTEPSLETALTKAADDQIGVVIYPLTFVSEHVETLVELDIEYQERAAHMGLPFYARVPTVGTQPRFIEGLRDLVLAAEGTRICPGNLKRCYYQEKKHG